MYEGAKTTSRPHRQTAISAQAHEYAFNSSSVRIGAADSRSPMDHRESDARWWRDHVHRRNVYADTNRCMGSP